MSIADRIISELVYGRWVTYPETRTTPEESALYCKECGAEEGDEHRDPPDNSDDIEAVAELPIADTGDNW